MASPNAAEELGKKTLSPGFNVKMPKPGPWKSHVPSNNQSSETSGFSIKVEAGKPSKADFDVKSK